MKVTERVEDHHETQEEVPFGKLHRRRRPEMIVVECECGRRQTLTGVMPGEGERGSYSMSAVREGHYSWLNDCLEWLEGKEARHEYYARLEEQAALR